MKISIDLRSDIPVTSQIVAQIQQLLANGGLIPGDQLPTVRALAAELRVNFNTVARAYRILDENGIISTQQGRGTFILEQPPPETTSALKRETLSLLARRYLEEASRLGFSSAESVQAVREEGEGR